ncbi:MAG TPA: hypothetical protein VK034_22320 [Enhygromyxa sp.]|nr:hypothetical protein [Enhygromyxa sp.]
MLDAGLHEAVAAIGELAARDAIIGVEDVSVVAFLKADMEVAVATIGDLARWCALAILAVFRAEIALFAEIDDPVAAAGGAAFFAVLGRFGAAAGECSEASVAAGL